VAGQKSKTGDKHPYYMCFNKGCGSYRKSIRRDVIEGEFADLLRDVAPSPAKLSLAKRMFSAAWNQRQESARENAALYANRIGELDAQVETLLSRLMEADTSTVIKAYEKKIGELEQQKLLLAEKAEATGKPRAAFEQLFELAIKFPANLWKVWESGRFDLQRLVLRLAFAERLPYSRETGFRTPELSFPFKALGGESMQDCKMAEEPVWSYPVSAKFPANREINRVFLLFSGNQCWDRRKTRRLFNALSEISLPTGTGNFFEPNKVISSSSRELGHGGTILPMQAFRVI
jgi:hypothetical protein